ncbi:hypothetical protein KIW84_044080 [Lathyrus oleraceus]|uniref:Uncharacterized protein n=1 Tax=Pisum sativum TaxID=3888 RepID=A0A9D5ASK0_PEA|nr:hypothetical protein KIW84_044080 [Pisum sativum]
MRLKESVADYVAVTPIVSKDGAVILGSKRSTVFEVDAKAGKILRSYGAADFHNASTTAVWSGDKNRERFSTIVGANNNELADPGKLNLPEFLLQIVRTDYLFYNLWVLASLDAEGEHASDVDNGLDFAMSSYQENGMLPMPVSHLMLPSQPKSGKFLPGHNGNMMLPGPVPNSLQPEISFYDSNDNNAVVLPQPHMEIAAPREIDVNRVQISDSDLKSPPSKKKRARKSGKSDVIVEKQNNHLYSVEENIRIYKECRNLLGDAIAKYVVRCSSRGRRNLKHKTNVEHGALDIPNCSKSMSLPKWNPGKEEGTDTPLALIIDGNSLVYILEKELESELFDLAISCKVVLCCRVAPLQKAGIVDLIKSRTNDNEQLANGHEAIAKRTRLGPSWNDIWRLR